MMTGSGSSMAMMDPIVGMKFLKAPATRCERAQLDVGKHRCRSNGKSVQFVAIRQTAASLQRIAGSFYRMKESTAHTNHMRSSKNQSTVITSRPVSSETCVLSRMYLWYCMHRRCMFRLQSEVIRAVMQ